MRPSLGANAARAALTQEVRESVLAWRVGVAYEPLVDLRTGETIGHEALTRFLSAEGKPIAPNRIFLELRREPALLADVEIELKRLQMERAPGRCVFLNLDPEGYALEALRRENRFLMLLAARRDLDLVIEVVESLHATGASRAREMIQELRSAGISVALDDVGASGALFSLDALRGADVVKFDRSLLDRPADPRERAIVRGLVAVARALGARTVLEGIERPEQLKIAEALGVDLVQGFLFQDRSVLVAPAP